MYKTILLFSSLLTLTIFISCSDDTVKSEKTQSESIGLNISDINQVDTTYLHTGFYFLTNDDTSGINMKVENSNEFYSLNKEPFASVDNISQTKLQTTKLDQGDYTELCLKFDNKGTKDLEQGTGNPLHSKIAVVIAGKLLYVVDNGSKIKTGVMCVGLVNYTNEEMLKIKLAVDHKQ